jgi:hypothetical protein
MTGNRATLWDRTRLNVALSDIYNRQAEEKKRKGQGLSRKQRTSTGHLASCDTTNTDEREDSSSCNTVYKALVQKWNAMQQSPAAAKCYCASLLH